MERRNLFRSFDASVGGNDSMAQPQSTANEMKQLQLELQRQHLKKQHADIEDIVKLQAKKRSR